MHGLTLAVLAVDSGFLSEPMRRRVWPLLLNLHGEDPCARQRDVEPLLEHREMKQVQLDVVRSLTHFGMLREEREARLKQLSRVINSVLAANPTLHYYQGYNDVCSVAIMVMGEEHSARQVAQQLARYHLREAMHPTMAAVQAALSLMMLILKRRDKQLYACLRACEVEPVFAISWIITWFAHDIKSLQNVERLYDFFLASHPLMSLYFSASLLSWQRTQLLQVCVRRRAALATASRAAHLCARVYPCTRMRAHDEADLGHAIGITPSRQTATTQKCTASAKSCLANCRCRNSSTMPTVSFSKRHLPLSSPKQST